jgi:hypothetical protein
MLKFGRPICRSNAATRPARSTSSRTFMPISRMARAAPNRTVGGLGSAQQTQQRLARFERRTAHHAASALQQIVSDISDSLSEIGVLETSINRSFADSVLAGGLFDGCAESQCQNQLVFQSLFDVGLHDPGLRIVRFVTDSASLGYLGSKSIGFESIGRSRASSASFCKC